VEFEVGLVLLFVLAAAWLGVRHFVRKGRQQREAQRRRLNRLRAQAPTKGKRDSLSQRSEMRSTAAPVTIVDTISHGGNRRPSADTRGKAARRRH
jgi:hypothetical protein